MADAGVTWSGSQPPISQQMPSVPSGRQRQVSQPCSRRPPDRESFRRRPTVPARSVLVSDEEIVAAQAELWQRYRSRPSRRRHRLAAVHANGPPNSEIRRSPRPCAAPTPTPERSRSSNRRPATWRSCGSTPIPTWAPVRSPTQSDLHQPVDRPRYPGSVAEPACRKTVRQREPAGPLNPEITFRDCDLSLQRQHASSLFHTWRPGAGTHSIPTRRGHSHSNLDPRQHALARASGNNMIRPVDGICSNRLPDFLGAARCQGQCGGAEWVRVRRCRGSGQAGLAASHELGLAGVEHVVLERDRIAQAWRDRWDSFTLVTPNWTLDLPGSPYAGTDPEGHVPRDEIVDYLDATPPRRWCAREFR